MNLQTLNLSEYLRYAYANQDDLTSTELEKESLRRLEAFDSNDAVDAVLETEFSADELRKMAEAMQEYDADDVAALLTAITGSVHGTAEVAEFLKLLETANITEPDELKESLEFATKFRAIANDAGDVFTRLTTLISETQED